MSPPSSTDLPVSNGIVRQNLLVNGNQKREGENVNGNPDVKVIVTFFARPKASTGDFSSITKFSPSLELDFSSLLASLASPAPPIIPSFQSLSPHVHQATYTTSRRDTSNLRHHPLISAFEASHSLEIVVDILSDGAVSYRPIRLAIFDMDSTLINEEVIDELARSIGVASAVSAITAQSMNGDIDFTESLRARLALLNGVDTGVWKELEKSLSISAGARELFAELRRRGVITAVASGGFIPMAEWLKNELGIDYAFANHVRGSFSFQMGSDVSHLFLPLGYFSVIPFKPQSQPLHRSVPCNQNTPTLSLSPRPAQEKSSEKKKI